MVLGTRPAQDQRKGWWRRHAVRSGEYESALGALTACLEHEYNVHYGIEVMSFQLVTLIGSGITDKAVS